MKRVPKQEDEFHTTIKNKLFTYEKDQVSHVFVGSFYGNSRFQPTEEGDAFT